MTKLSYSCIVSGQKKSTTGKSSIANNDISVHSNTRRDISIYTMRCMLYVFMYRVYACVYVIWSISLPRRRRRRRRSLADRPQRPAVCFQCIIHQRDSINYTRDFRITRYISYVYTCRRILKQWLKSNVNIRETLGGREKCPKKLHCVVCSVLFFLYVCVWFMARCCAISECFLSK